MPAGREVRMDGLALFVRGVERLNEWTGRVVAWLTLGTVLACFATV